MRIAYVSLILFFYQEIFAQILPPKEAYSLDVKQIHSGHSLTDPLFVPWPGVYIELVSSQLNSSAYDFIGKSTIPGSPMLWRWENPPCCDAPDARHDISDWELLSITERVPLYYEGGNTADWYLQGLAAQREMMSTWTNHTWENGKDGNGAATLLWTTWTNIDDSDGPWRDMLDILGNEWEIMQDFANDRLLDGSPPVYLIPGHKMMARLYDDIQAGLVPDVTHISQLFSDNIHVNDTGAYAVALIHYACIFNRNPAGLPYDLHDDVNPPSPALAAYLQNMIWDVVTNYNRTGLSEEMNNSKHPENSKVWTISPNPANQFLNIQTKDDLVANYVISDITGKIIQTGSVSSQVALNLASGLYILTLFNNHYREQHKILVIH